MNFVIKKNTFLWSNETDKNGVKTNKTIKWGKRRFICVILIKTRFICVILIKRRFICVILIKTNSKKYSFIYEEQKLQQHSETLITYDRVIERDLSRGSNHCQIYQVELFVEIKTGPHQTLLIWQTINCRTLDSSQHQISLYMGQSSSSKT